MPLGRFPRYYPAFQYLGLPSGSVCLSVLHVDSGSEPKRKDINSESVEDVTNRILSTERKAAQVAVNQRLNLNTNVKSTSSVVDAKNINRIENAKQSYRNGERNRASCVGYEF